jgi:hypothetical protein
MMMKLSHNLPGLNKLLCAFAWGLIQDTLCIKINWLLNKRLEFNVAQPLLTPLFARLEKYFREIILRHQGRK